MGRSGISDITTVFAFRRSADLLSSHGSQRDRSEAFRAWAKMLRSAGRESEALDVTVLRGQRRWNARGGHSRVDRV